MPDTRVITVAAVGVSEWERSFLQATVGIESGADIGAWRWESDVDRARVVIAAVGTQPGNDWLYRVASGAQSPLVVALCDRPGPVLSGTQALLRPVARTNVVALFRSIEQMLRNPPASVAPPVPAPAAAVKSTPPQAPSPPPKTPPPSDIAAPEVADDRLARKSRRSARFYDNSRLLGLLRSAMMTRSDVEITHARYPSLQLFPGRGVYVCSTDVLASPSMFRAGAHEFHVEPLAPARAEQLLHAATARPLVGLLYAAAAHGSEGRLFPDTDSEDEFEFVSLPGFERLPLSSAQEEMARRLMSGPVSLRELIAEDDMDAESLIDSLNGFEAAGCLRRRHRGELIKPTGVPVPGETHTGSTMNRLRALFSGMLHGPRAGS